MSLDDLSRREFLKKSFVMSVTFGLASGGQSKESGQNQNSGNKTNQTKVIPPQYHKKDISDKTENKDEDNKNQELYTQLREYALKNKEPKLDESLVGKWVIYYEPINYFEFHFQGKRQQPLHERSDYSENGTIYVGKVSKVMNVSLGEKILIEWFYFRSALLRRLLHRRPSHYPLPFIGVNFEGAQDIPTMMDGWEGTEKVSKRVGKILQVTPQEINIIYKPDYTKQYPDKFTEIRVLDNENLANKVDGLIKNLK